MKDVKEFIINYIEKEGKLPENIDIDSFNYIDTGYIDSVGLMSFAVALEKKFDITIEDDEILNPKFKTIGGLSEIIKTKIS